MGSPKWKREKVFRHLEGISLDTLQIHATIVVGLDVQLWYLRQKIASAQDKAGHASRWDG